MNTCRLCNKIIPVRLCFCTVCTRDRLTNEERIKLMVPQTTVQRETAARSIVNRVNNPARPSRPPVGDAEGAFRAARRALAPLLGDKT